MWETKTKTQTQTKHVGMWKKNKKNSRRQMSRFSRALFVDIGGKTRGGFSKHPKIGAKTQTQSLNSDPGSSGIG